MSTVRGINIYRKTRSKHNLLQGTVQEGPFTLTKRFLFLHDSKLEQNLFQVAPLFRERALQSQTIGLYIIRRLCSHKLKKRS
jgi:hypothetical protein